MGLPPPGAVGGGGGAYGGTLSLDATEGQSRMEAKVDREREEEKSRAAKRRNMEREGLWNSIAKDARQEIHGNYDSNDDINRS